MGDFSGFVDPGVLCDGDLQLRLVETLMDHTGEEVLPTYRFQMISADSGNEIGFINLRIGSGENLVLYRGHLGYGVNPEFRGHGFAARACALLIPLARHHGINPIWITCNPDLAASRKPCERLGAQLVEILNVPENTEAYRAGARVKCRYRLDI